MPGSVERHNPLTALLDKIGKQILLYGQANVLVVLSIASALLMWMMRAARRRKTEGGEVVQLAFGILSLCSGVVIAAVLVLTTPPAYQELSEGSRHVAGLVTFIILVVSGVTAIREFLSKP